VNSASLKITPRATKGPAYDVRYRREGKSKSLRFEDRKTAEAWIRAYKLYGFETVKAQYSEPSELVPTVDEFADTYINSKSGVEGKTLDHYRSFMRTWISPVFGGLPLSMVTPETITGWVNGMAKQKSSEKSIKNRHGFLYAMFSQAIDRGIIDRNPCKGTRIGATERPDMMVLTREQYANLREHLPTRYRPFVDLMLMTGMRFGEATALRATDFDLNAETVKVARAWKYSAEKSWYVGPPKTKKSRRTISLPPEWRVDILRLVESSKTEYVFTNGSGRPIRQSTFHKAVWDPARRKAWGLPANKPKGEHVQLPRVHDLRHTHASWLVASGLPLSYVQERMGHESINTTISTYSKTAPDYLSVTAQAMSLVLSGALPISGHTYQERMEVSQ